MTSEEIKEKVLEYDDWELFFERPFGAFILSLFMGGNSRQSMKKIGFDIEHPAVLFENGAWYLSNKVYELASADIKKEIPKGLSVRKISESCEKFRDTKRAEIIELLKDNNKTSLEKFKQIVDILKSVTSYIWLAHDYEYYYTPIFKAAVEKNFGGDIDKIIGDISYPEKRSSHNYLEEELLAGVDSSVLSKKYGWLKTRDGFADPYSPTELDELRKKTKDEGKKPILKVNVPESMKELVAEIRELVYYRTLRTDVFYEFIFLARPVTMAVGKMFNLDFKELRDYSVYDLLTKSPIKYSPFVTCAYYKNEAAFFTKPILERQSVKNSEVKGIVAFKGKVTGRAKIVKKVEELQKVEEGNILIAPMTSPNFLVAMKKAAAFVTDEGGITCHAAIVAREMQKPCIIGTKVATKMFKDGDLIEVDANTGIVSITN